MDQSKNKGHSSPETSAASARAAARDAESDTEPRKGDKAPKVNEHDFPRMLHKGEARMVVNNEQELKDAKADGWTFKHKPPPKLDAAANAKAVIREEHAHIAAMTDIAQLETLRNELVGQPIVAGTRTAEVRAIEARIAELRAVNQPKPPEAPKEGVPAAGDVAVRTEIANAGDVATLKALREQEMNSPGGGRRDVLAAIAVRIEELAGG